MLSRGVWAHIVRAASSEALRLCGISSIALRNTDPPDRVQFAVGHSSHASLSAATVDCVQQIKSQLGPLQPHLLQLLVSGAPYGTTALLAPLFVYECFLSPTAPSPVLLGGVVEAVLTSHPHPHLGNGVSLLAARLPGVQLHPFHTAADALPPLSVAQWTGLLQPGQPPPSLLLLCEPHFVEVESFMRRLHGALQRMNLAGGVVAPLPSPCSTSSAFPTPGPGAVFLGPQAHREGVVGCILQGGGLQVGVDTATSCLPVGPAMAVTESRGNAVMQLDGRPAQAALAQALASTGHLAAGGHPMHVGLDTSGTGHGFATRRLGPPAPGHPTSVQLSVGEVPSGSVLVLQHIDPQAGARTFDTTLQSARARLRCTESGAGPGALVVFSCTEVDHQEAAAVAGGQGSGVVVQGAKMGGEFMSFADGQASTMASFTSVVASLGPPS